MAGLPSLRFEPGREPPPAGARLVCELVLDLFRARFPAGPVKGERAICLVERDEPQVLVGVGAPDEYVVALTCLYSPRINQIAYQFGHELLHVFAAPDLVHPFAELLACAASLATLKLLAVQCASKGALAPYAGKFQEYHDRVVEAAWQHFGMDSRSAVATGWPHTFEMGCDDRMHQLAAASLMEDWLTSRPSAWTMLSQFPASFSAGKPAVGSAEATERDTLAVAGTGAPHEVDWRAGISRTLWRQACIHSPHAGAGDAGFVDEFCNLFRIGD